MPFTSPAGMRGAWIYSSTHFVTRTLDGAERLASSPDASSSGKSRTHPLSGRLGGPQSRSAHFGGKKSVFCVLAFGSSKAPWGLRDRPDGWEGLKEDSDALSIFGCGKKQVLCCQT